MMHITITDEDGQVFHDDETNSLVCAFHPKSEDEHDLGIAVVDYADAPLPVVAATLASLLRRIEGDGEENPLLMGVVKSMMSMPQTEKEMET